MTAIRVLRWHILIIALVIAAVFYSTATADAGCMAKPWKTGYGQATVNKYGNTVEPTIYIDYSYRYNGCTVQSLYVSFSARTTPFVSVKKTWAGAYVPPGSSYIDVGANWTDYLTPVSGFGPSWADYERVRIYASGARSTPWPHIW